MPQAILTIGSDTGLIPVEEPLDSFIIGQTGRSTRRCFSRTMADGGVRFIGMYSLGVSTV